MSVIKRLEIIYPNFIPGDVVEYYLMTPKLGKSCRLGGITETYEIHPLCLRNENQNELFYDINEKSLRLDSVNIIRTLSGVQWMQRIVEDRISNPHGEHAEDVFVIRSDFPRLEIGDAVYLPILDGDYH